MLGTVFVVLNATSHALATAAAALSDSSIDANTILLSLLAFLGVTIYRDVRWTRDKVGILWDWYERNVQGGVPLPPSAPHSQKKVGT